jgi:hypothetical protein
MIMIIKNKYLQKAVILVIIIKQEITIPLQIIINKIILIQKIIN